MTLKKPWQWLPKAAEMITDFEEGQVENSTQHNTAIIGVPGTGKNHTKCMIEEWGMRGKYLKTIYPHCATEGHLKEVLKYTLPNGFFEEQKARTYIETIRTNLQNTEYQNASLAWEELDAYELLEDDKKSSSSTTAWTRQRTTASSSCCGTPATS